MTMGWRQAFILSVVLVAVQAQDLQLSDIVGDAAARTAACSNYTLQAPYNNVTYSTSFEGPALSVVVGGTTFAYRRFGPLNPSAQDSENNTLVLIAGAAATSKVWPADLLRPLADGREVVIFDNPGTGGTNTTIPSDQLTIDGIAQSLLGFFDALNLDQPDILGWSLGGYYALYLGTTYGDSIGSIVLVSTTAGGDGYFPGLYTEQVYTPPDQDVPHAALYPDTTDGNDGLCRFLQYSQIMPGYNITSGQIGNQSIVTQQLLNETIITDNLQNLTNPVLILAAEEDVILDFENSLYLYNNINQSYILYRSYAGHAYLLQDTESILPTVESFLDYYDYFEDYSDTGNTDYSDAPTSSAESA